MREEQTDLCSADGVQACRALLIPNVTEAAMPDFTAPLEVVIERGRVWIKRAHQSFMLAYDDTENMEWYAAQLRRVLALPSAQDWLKERAPDQHAAWAAGNAAPATVDWMAGWEACRAAAAGVPARVTAADPQCNEGGA